MVAAQQATRERNLDKPSHEAREPAHDPIDDADAPTSTRAKIAAEFKMHPEHVALPGEVPIKRRPRMSRGKYDPARFDYRAFLPQATALAKQEVADAQLVGFDIRGVAPDGRANITRVETTGAEYRFLTKMPLEEGCIIAIDVFPDKIETYVESPVICERPVVKTTQCTFAQIWDKARADGTKSGVASLAFDHNGWNFSSDDLVHSYPDDCK